MDGFDRLMMQNEPTCKVGSVAPLVMARIEVRKLLRTYIMGAKVALLISILLAAGVFWSTGALKILAAILKSHSSYGLIMQTLWVSPVWLLIPPIMLAAAWWYLRKLETLLALKRITTKDKRGGTGMSLISRVKFVTMGLGVGALSLSAAAVFAYSTPQYHAKVKAQQAKVHSSLETPRCYGPNCGPVQAGGKEGDGTGVNNEVSQPRCYTPSGCGPQSTTGTTDSNNELNSGGVNSSGSGDNGSDVTPTPRCYGPNCGPVQSGGGNASGNDSDNNSGSTEPSGSITSGPATTQGSSSGSEDSQPFEGKTTPNRFFR